MARRQLEIDGTQRSDVPPEILEAGEKWIDLRTSKRRVGEKAKEAKYGLIALMQSRKVSTFRYKDPETGETRSLTVADEPKISVRKVTEEEESLPASAVNGASTEPSVHPGLIAQAEKAQADAGVAENEEGDVVPTDASVPKSKKRGGKKGK